MALRTRRLEKYGTGRHVAVTFLVDLLQMQIKRDKLTLMQQRVHKKPALKLSDNSRETFSID